MRHLYSQIPLHLLLDQEYFQQASEIFLTSFALDIHFAETYLSSLRPDAKLYVVVENMEDEVLQYLKRPGVCGFQYFQNTRKLMLGFKHILIKSVDSSVSIITTVNFTQSGLKDDFGRHRFSVVESEFDYLKKKYFNNGYLFY
jgi:hypothetical protein